MRGRCLLIRLHVDVAWSYTSYPASPFFYLFHITPHSIQPSYIRPSSLLTPLHLHVHFPPSDLSSAIGMIIITESIYVIWRLYGSCLRLLQPPVAEKCVICTKSVYAAERSEAGGKIYHKNCFKCSQCKLPLK